MEQLSQQELNQKIERFLKSRLSAHPKINDITEEQFQKSRSFVLKVKGYVGRQIFQKAAHRRLGAYQQNLQLMLDR